MNGVEKSRTFLTEFIIVILFFSIAAVIIVNLFVKADEKSKDSERLTEFTLMARNLETELSNACYDYANPLGEADNSPFNELEKVGFINAGNNTMICYLDKNYEATDKSNSEYIIEINTAIDESIEYSKIVSYEITFMSNDINSLESKKYYSVSFNKIVFGKEN